ncbi:MAG: CHRD domain-containing protein, partial [Planctomycetota bacterium]
GMFFVNPSRAIDYLVTTQNLANGTVAHIHQGAFGINGPIDIALSGGPKTWAGTTAPISPAQFTTLQNLGYYLNVHNLADPGGHIRGQMVLGQTLYGVSSPGSGAFQCTLSVEGPPRPGIVVKIRITGGKPNGTGRLRVAAAPDNRMENGMCVWVKTKLVINKGVVLNANGNRVISARVKNFPASRDFYLQFIGDDSPRPYASNAAFVPVEIF